MKTVTILLLACTMQAASLSFSSVGTLADANQTQQGGASVAIAQHPGWAAPLPGSSWVSYGVTGNPSAAGYFVPANGTVVAFYQLINLPFAPLSASVTFRADDSAALWVNGTLVVPEAPTAGNNYDKCSDFPVGCLISTQVAADLVTYLHAGANTIEFDVAQRHGSSFGLNYAGTVEWRERTRETPEPITGALIAFGLAGMVAAYRRRR